MSKPTREPLHIRDEVAHSSRAGAHERFRRLGWLALWLVARHSVRIWLSATTSP